MRWWRCLNRWRWGFQWQCGNNSNRLTAVLFLQIILLWRYDDDEVSQLNCHYCRSARLLSIPSSYCSNAFDHRPSLLDTYYFNCTYSTVCICTVELRLSAQTHRAVTNQARYRKLISWFCPRFHFPVPPLFPVASYFDLDDKAIRHV